MAAPACRGRAIAGAAMPPARGLPAPVLAVRARGRIAARHPPRGPRAERASAGEGRHPRPRRL